MHLVISTFANVTDAEKTVRSLVEQNLAACGTILPGARSIYRWKGVIEDVPETVVIFKTAVPIELFEQKLQEIHPYEVPEVTVLDPLHVSRAYGEWVIANSTVVLP